MRAALRILLLLIPAARAADDVDLLLVLAVDASGSVNTECFELQKPGHVAAFRNLRLVRAVQGGPGAFPVAAANYESFADAGRKLTHYHSQT